MKRILIVLGVVVGGFVAVYCFYFWRENGATALNPVALHRSYTLGDLTGTATAIRASGTADSDLLLLAASCYRRLGQVEEFREVIDEAREKDVDPELLKLATDLFDVQVGNFGESSDEKLSEFERRGVAKDEARSAVILGAINRGDFAGATSLIDQWYLEQSDAHALGYLRAMLARSLAQSEEAETLLMKSIAYNEQHELSYLALAQLYSQPPSIHLEKCRLVLTQCQLRFPENRNARTYLARINRELGDIDSANEILPTEGLSQAEAIEKAELALDAGDYAKSIEWMRQGELSDTSEFIAIIDMAFQMNLSQPSISTDELSRRAKFGAIALALGGRTKEAAVVFDFMYDRVARLRRMSDLQVKAGILPGNQTIIDEINAMVSPAYNPGYPTLTAMRKNEIEDLLAPGYQLYVEHCAGCHGRTGDGQGRASRHLFPAPRNFRDQPMRIVSTTNRLASNQDLATAIRNGLGGASMPAFPNFSNEQVEQLVAVVRRLQINGLRQQYERRMRETGVESDTSDEVEVDGDSADLWVKQRSTPGASLQIPSFDETSASNAANGKVAFNRAGCNLCHVGSGRTNNGIQGPNVLRLFDTLGSPVPVRNLANDVFRGGNSRQALYSRIVLGMPGTPHPAIGDLAEKEILDIVEYVHQLSNESHKSAKPRSGPSTNFQRRLKSAL